MVLTQVLSPGSLGASETSPRPTPDDRGGYRAPGIPIPSGAQTVHVLHVYCTASFIRKNTYEGLLTVARGHRLSGDLGAYSPKPKSGPFVHEM